jgi:hypothetical protein
MASANNNSQNKLATHEGGMAAHIKPVEQLRRVVMACLLWEDQFYEDGVSLADRVKELLDKVSEEDARQILLEAKFDSKLRHLPLYLLVLFAQKKWLTKDDIYQICTRCDDMTELLALYFQDGKKPLSHQLVKGLQKAFTRFDEYQLAKYNRQKEIKLRDVLRLVRPKPKDEEQSLLWKRLVKDELETPDTWEVAISACGSDNEKKAAEYTRLIEERKLGDLAFLRNLRKMTEVGVSETVIRRSFEDRQWGWIIPYQFIAAAQYNPTLEDALEPAMFKCLKNAEPITQKTALLIDVSGSMISPLSKRSEVLRSDAAIGLGILFREICENVQMFAFTGKVFQIPPRRGFALRDALKEHLGGSTAMWRAITEAGKKRHNEIMVVITDEQTMDTGNFSNANADLLVIINIASYTNGVGYEKGVLHISGWSDSIVHYLQTYLKSDFDKVSD